MGDNLGILIGRRGETLDAIQHLTNYAINRGQNKRVRINVDAESYRLKREQALQRLAQKVAGKVTRYRRNITLEPMNAYERHVIHAALQDHPDVTTFLHRHRAQPPHCRGLQPLQVRGSRREGRFPRDRGRISTK